MPHHLKTFFTLSASVLALTFALSYWQQPLSGDLTRMGFYSERDYGGQTHQIRQSIAASGAAVVQPDFWVLGDSFSKGNEWQSVIKQKVGISSQTFHYDKITCVNQWVRQAAIHPSIKTVIVEVAELHLLTRFAQLTECADTLSNPTEIASGYGRNESVKSFDVSHDWRLKHSAITQINTWRVNHFNLPTVKDAQVTNSILKPDCANFSNRRSDRLLYQTGSLDHPQKTAATYAQAAANLLSLQKRVEAHGKQFLLVVIPDKFSAYQNCIADNTATAGESATPTCDYLVPAGVTCLNLMPLIDAERLKTPDLYLPNDTHFSHAGYRLLANAVSPYLR